MIGRRWEVELEWTDDGGLRADQWKPRDEPADDPVELKGAIESLGQGSFVLNGFVVRMTESTRRQLAEGAVDDRLSPGMIVKVRGSFDGEALVAERVKVYGADVEDSFELRGPVEEVQLEEGGGRIRLGGRWIEVDGDTEFEDFEEGESLTRAEVRRALDLGAEGAAAQGFVVALTSYDLGVDPSEAEGTPASTSDTLSGLMDRSFQELVLRRSFREEDRVELTEEAIQGLRDIGYVE